MPIQIRTSLAEPETADTYVPHRPARPAKAEGGRPFALQSDYEPAGDQPQAIEELVGAVNEGEKSQVLLGVTGSGKTFTMAKVIQTLQRPALVIAPNKILAAQLYGEFKFADQILLKAYGYPMKIRVPTKLGFKNPKYVISMEVTNDYKGGYWEDQGYNSFSGS